MEHGIFTDVKTDGWQGLTETGAAPGGGNCQRCFDRLV